MISYSMTLSSLLVGAMAMVVFFSLASATASLPASEIKRFNTLRKETAFLSSVYMNDMDIVDMFIRDGGDVNVFSDEGLSALHVAAMHGYSDILSRLLTAGSDVNQVTKQHGMTALELAAIRGSVECIRALLDVGCDPQLNSPNDSALRFAVQWNHWDVVKVFLLMNSFSHPMEYYAPVFQWSVENSFMQVIDILLDNNLVEINMELEEGENILVYAARNGNSVLLHDMIARGGDVNAASTPDRITPLHVAAMHGNVGVVKVLLDGGANVNAADRHAITALRWAVVYNHVDTAKLLLMSNARIHSSPDSDISQDTLHWITANNYVDMADVFLLMSSDIRINAKRNGMTALHVAALNQYHKMAEILVLHGAEIDVRDDLGLAPYHYALKHGSDDDALVRLLQLPLRNRSSPYEIDLQSYVVDEKTRTSSNANRIVLPLINPNFDPPFKQNMTNHALEIQTNHVHPTY